MKINEATMIARQAFEYTEAGRDEEAIQLYRKSLSMADSHESDLWQIHGEFASALERIGDLAGSREQLEFALGAALRDARSADCPAVAVARYFLGDLLLKLGEPETALATIEPSFCGTCAEAPLRTVQSIAYWQLGEYSAAKDSVRKAVVSAQSDAQRDSIKERLKYIQHNG